MRFVNCNLHGAARAQLKMDDRRAAQNPKSQNLKSPKKQNHKTSHWHSNTNTHSHPVATARQRRPLEFGILSFGIFLGFGVLGFGIYVRAVTS